MAILKAVVTWWGWILVLFAILAVWSYGGTLEPPSGALLEWTEWLTKVVALIVAARTVMTGAAALRKKAGLDP